jgi:hypothetical protein
LPALSAATVHAYSLMARISNSHRC